MRILVIEDDAALASYIRKGLESEHYAVDVALDGEQGALMAADLDYDLLILDLNLPKLDGISVLRSIRPGKPQLPVLVLTARTRVEDRIFALDSGADDCVNKPFSYSELSARVRALLRRGRPCVESVLQVADLELNRVERRVQRGGRRIELTAKEFALLEYLMRNAGRKITRSMIIEHVWNLNFDTRTNVVDVYINYLAGLAHDLGILVNVLLIPREFSHAFRIAVETRRPLRDVEREQIGITHDVTGDLLSSHWHLFDYLSEVMRRHHDVGNATREPVLASLVNIADLLCRTSGLGYGYEEDMDVSLQEEPAWKVLAAQSPRLNSLDMACFNVEIQSYVQEVRTLVSVLFRL